MPKLGRDKNKPKTQHMIDRDHVVLEQSRKKYKAGEWNVGETISHLALHGWSASMAERLVTKWKMEQEA